LLTDLLYAFHPVAVAQRILPEREFLGFAGTELRKIKYLYGDTLLEKVLVGFLAEQKVDVKSLVWRPEPDNLRSRSYCPVCLTQYVIDAGLCNDCDNVSLHPFAIDPNQVTKTN
jgi:hypothetical protein